MTDKPSPMDLDSPGIEWGGAFWYWAHSGGDMSQIIDLLRAGVSLDPGSSATLADILSGEVVPRIKIGGPSRGNQDRVAWRNRRIRELFDIIREDLRASGRYGRGKHADLRSDAIAAVAKASSLSPASVKAIVDGPAPRFVEESFDELTVRPAARKNSR